MDLRQAKPLHAGHEAFVRRVLDLENRAFTGDQSPVDKPCVFQNILPKIRY